MTIERFHLSVLIRNINLQFYHSILFSSCPSRFEHLNFPLFLSPFPLQIYPSLVYFEAIRNSSMLILIVCRRLAILI